MSENFQECLDKFVKNMIIKIDKKELLPVIQQEYDDLIEVYQGLSVLTNEEFESLDKTISDYDLKLKQMQEIIKSYKTQQINDQEKNVRYLKMKHKLGKKENYRGKKVKGDIQIDRKELIELLIPCCS